MSSKILSTFLDGIYESCLSKNEFVACAEGHEPRTLACPANLEYDSNTERCEYPKKDCGNFPG